MTSDAIFRIASQTKAITSVAAMILIEEGKLALNDPVSRYIPEFAGLEVSVKDADGNRHLVDPERPMSVRDAMMHMTGIGYGPPNARMDLESLGARAPAMRLAGGGTLQTLMERLGGEPLRFHPGSHWLYSWSTDVCARLVEVLSGQRFDDYLQATIFDPLGMVDTGFSVTDENAGRFAALYRRNAAKELVLLDDPQTSRYREHPEFLSGGGGLVATAADYLRFCHMLAGGGEVDGVRVLAPKTVELMRTNHLPGGGDLRRYALPGGYGEVGFDGMGFGLTVAVSKGPAATQAVGSAGEFMWGGAASTIFWIDPVEELVTVFMTQLMPSGTFNFRGQLKSLVYGALVE